MCSTESGASAVWIHVFRTSTAGVPALYVACSSEILDGIFTNVAVRGAGGQWPAVQMRDRGRDAACRMPAYAS